MRLRTFAVPALAMLLLAGCTSGRRDLEDWVAAEKAKKGAPIDPLPVVKTFDYEFEAMASGGPTGLPLEPRVANDPRAGLDGRVIIQLPDLYGPIGGLIASVELSSLLIGVALGLAIAAIVWQVK